MVATILIFGIHQLLHKSSLFEEDICRQIRKHNRVVNGDKILLNTDALSCSSKENHQFKTKAPYKETSQVQLQVFNNPNNNSSNRRIESMINHGSLGCKVTQTLYQQWAHQGKKRTVFCIVFTRME